MAAEVEEDAATCAVCGEGDWDETNVILFCDGCNLAVHQVCYGGGACAIPEGPWFCAKCEAGSPDAACCLCAQTGGAMKRTSDWRWAHIVCAVWMPNVSFHDPESRDVVDIVGIDDRRFGLTCSLCATQAGACIQCKERKCLRAFHVTCAHTHGLQRVEKEHAEWVELGAFCPKHQAKKIRKHPSGLQNPPKWTVTACADELP